MTFKLTMLPARDGDCLLLTWGEGADLYHVLIDLGRAATYEDVKARLTGLENVELLVVSHVDADHIAGAMPMVRESEPPFAPARVWFNGRRHLVKVRDRGMPLESYSPAQGDKLSSGIKKFRWAWNTDFESRIVSTDSPEAMDDIELTGGLRLRLLSPNDDALLRLLARWPRTLEDASLRLTDTADEPAPEAEIPDRFEAFSGLNVKKLADPLNYERDSTAANGSSIAFLAEFRGKRILLAADAHSETLEDAIRPLAQAAGGKLPVDLLKVAHHGSQANTKPSFIDLLDCTRFAFSTNGPKRHKHPHAETVSRILFADRQRMKTLYFNYRQDYNEKWDVPALTGSWHYECVFPVADKSDPHNGTLEIPI